MKPLRKIKPAKDGRDPSQMLRLDRGFLDRGLLRQSFGEPPAGTTQDGNPHIQIAFDLFDRRRLGCRWLPLRFQKQFLQRYLRMWPKRTRRKVAVAWDAIYDLARRVEAAPAGGQAAREEGREGSRAGVVWMAIPISRSRSTCSTAAGLAAGGCRCVFKNSSCSAI